LWILSGGEPTERRKDDEWEVEGVSVWAWTAAGGQGSRKKKIMWLEREFKSYERKGGT